MYKNFYKILSLLLIATVGFGSSSFAIENEVNIQIPIKENILSENPIPEKKVVEDFQNKTVRILLSNKGVFEQKEIELYSEEEIFITSNNELVANSNNPIKIRKNCDYFLIEVDGIIKKVLINQTLLASTKSAPIKLNNFIKKGKNASYKGSIEISLSQKGNLRAINVVDINDYLKGVVPNEMPVSFGLEALKAQAIAARGYVYRDKTRKNPDYDVCDTTGSQVYNGANSYDKISDEAVDKTIGQFALYDGDIILSLYSSTAGGHTENYENAFSLNGLDTKFPGNPIPYLKGVGDYNYDLDLTKEENVREFYANEPNSFDINSTKYRWTYSWSKAELKNILVKNLMKNSTSKFITPALVNADDFGEIISIDVPKRGVSGKAMYVRIVTTKKVFIVAKEIMIRKIFTYNNRWLPSANIFFDEIKQGEQIVGFKVTGGGFGHGVGMSQYGASGMAKKGYKYDEILKHYYSDISIGSYPVECDLENMENCKATFYANKKNANLIIKYSSKPQDLTFKINDSLILVETKDFDKKEGQIKIKKWLKKGINTVELSKINTKLFDFSNLNVKFYVELVGKDEE